MWHVTCLISKLVPSSTHACNLLHISNNLEKCRFVDYEVMFNVFCKYWKLILKLQRIFLSYDWDEHFFPCKIHRSNKSHLFHFIWHGTPMRNVQLPLREQSSVHICLSFWKGPEALTKSESLPDSTLHSVLCLPPTLVPSFLRSSLSLKSKKVPLYIQKTL